ncbi:hypothetical protein FVEG_07435 [Fusarium verticillioides 7600]|uniref:Uncharacterized protein n=1 Tax=Gibberella moniliformis (strain M3125 / FGSC 7600) TaxID=334819 RepID=W7MI85_GIBM7|nr:hypothetical protein FVEG_07435 [Fusarium verticillioides 7600]EWG47290.1 hypothetical protein FVEG_07435 [Fusarium verticillioides 7600]RBQ88819.1 hypothetical protein FVER53263_07435 [Fusarium verticillioides]
MAYSFVESFFIGWAVGACTISLVVAIIVLALRGTVRGASLFSWLNKSRNPDVSETSTKQKPAATNVPAPQQIPESQVIRSPMNPNPITESHRELAHRVIDVCGPKGISENVEGFECLIESFCRNLIYGHGNVYTVSVPTIERSLFNDDELVRLAGDPPEGDTWSELICDRDTRYYAIWNFLVRLLYRRMDPDCNVEECLLPPEVSTCFQFIPERQFAHSKFNIHIAAAAVDSTDIISGEDCISVWREILFMMLMGRYRMIYQPATGLDKDDPRRERIDSMASEVADALNVELLDARGRSGADLKRVLTGIFGIAANCALIFFGQPSVWEANWDSDQGRLVAPRIRFMWNGQVKWTRPATVYNGPPGAPIVEPEILPHPKPKRTDLDA